jgi:DNA-binding CsgD family transcriptional regulator
MKKRKRKAGPRSNTLSEREIEVLMLICKEVPPGEIGRRLKLSEKTVQNHRASIKAKTKAKSNIGLYKYAVLQGYVKLNMARASKRVLRLAGIKALN